MVLSSDSESDDDLPLANMTNQNDCADSLSDDSNQNDDDSERQVAYEEKKSPLLESKKSNDTKNDKKSRKLCISDSEDDTDDSSDADQDANRKQKKVESTQQGKILKAPEREDSSSECSTSDSGVDDPYPAAKAKIKKAQSGSISAVDPKTSTKVKRKKKSSSDGTESSKVTSMKKYLRACGIHITNYKKLFENCKSMKAKERKLSDILVDAGVEGRPTLEKCKMVRLKREEEKEIAELDVGNIIASTGKRTTRSGVSRHKTRQVRDPEEDNAFSSLAGVVEAGSSEVEENTEERRPKRRKIQSSSEEESGEENNWKGFSLSVSD